MPEYRLTVEGLTCEHCDEAIESALGALGAAETSISSPSGRAAPRSRQRSERPTSGPGWRWSRPRRWTGTCVNVGCIPSKALLAEAETYHRTGHHRF